MERRHVDRPRGAIDARVINDPATTGRGASEQASGRRSEARSRRNEPPLAEHRRRRHAAIPMGRRARRNVSVETAMIVSGRSQSVRPQRPNARPVSAPAVSAPAANAPAAKPGRLDTRQRSARHRVRITRRSERAANGSRRPRLNSAPSNAASAPRSVDSVSLWS